jgi:hypothetical protein
VSTNEEAVQVLKEAMESPSWWTNRAGLTAREVVRRLEELGYTVARSSDVRVPVTAAVTPITGAAGPGAVAAGAAGAAHAPAESDEAVAARAQDQARIATLMAEVESSISAAREAREGTGSPLADEQRESA